MPQFFRLEIAPTTLLVFVLSSTLEVVPGTLLVFVLSSRSSLFLREPTVTLAPSGITVACNEINVTVIQLNTVGDLLDQVVGGRNTRRCFLVVVVGVDGDERGSLAQRITT